MKLRFFWYGLDEQPHRRHLWRDYWEVMGLAKSFSRLGDEVIWDYRQVGDVDILVYGKDHVHDLTAPKKFCWVNGRGWKAITEDWSAYNHVWLRSRTFLSKFQSVCPQSSTLLGSPTTENFIPRTESPKYEIVYLGAESAERIALLKFLMERYSVGVGGGVTEYLPQGKFGNEGLYIQNHEQGKFFNKGIIFLYTITSYIDTADGFISSAPLDAAATSEALILHEYGPGLRDVFSVVPSFNSQEEMVAQIDHYLAHKDSTEVKIIVEKSREEALAVSSDVVVRKMKETMHA